MGSLNKDSSVSASEIYNTAHRIIGTSELAIRNTQVNQTIVAEGGRDFSWVWMIVFIILLWPAAIIYYFTRKKNSISVTIVPKNDNSGCTVNIQAIGKNAELVFQNLSAAIR
ncbi:MAG: hypothetical protein AUH37_01075 [Candidatus Nitrososphaera sp. 13_1_40CM_48_12]|nr:MAG: hypothetical protein AUH71_04045 [Thaumarchaeota archaeon 13_1_40CM_4_48_7]OLC26211.1 MAG: hypothetical protein AUH37_01075 [Candidatus Nitrososphaera sp. 13_1_40CM_48_12]OLD27756.1 MAG: hypothetical protein AUI62_05185 [Thaumarchaeota archaeon 13_1_40CM_2_39_7]